MPAVPPRWKARCTKKPRKQSRTLGNARLTRAQRAFTFLQTPYVQHGTTARGALSKLNGTMVEHRKRPNNRGSSCMSLSACAGFLGTVSLHSCQIRVVMSRLVCGCSFRLLNGGYFRGVRFGNAICYILRLIVSTLSGAL